MFLLDQYYFGQTKHGEELTCANPRDKLGENFNFLNKGITSEPCGWISYTRRLTYKLRTTNLESMLLLDQYYFNQNKHGGGLSCANTGVKLEENFNIFIKGTASEPYG